MGVFNPTVGMIKNPTYIVPCKQKIISKVTAGQKFEQIAVIFVINL